MFRSYFKIAWRNLLKNRGYSSINIVGLAAGMTVATLIGLWIADELSFDSYFDNHARIAEVMLDQTDKGIVYTGPTIASPVEEPLRSKFGGDFKAIALCSYANETIVAFGDKKLVMPARWVQADFPEMFTLHMLAGTRQALKDPSTILLSRSVAKALFGDADPMNKMVRADNRHDLTVGGVFEDLPQNTTFANTKMLMPWHNPQNWNFTVTDWDNHSCLLFVQLADHANLEQVSQKIRSLPTPHIKDWKEEITLFAFDRLHLYGSEQLNGEANNAHIQFVWLFGTIGGFVLLLACINFMNLSTARSESRAKEVGIRKTIGSVRGQLVGQFLTESIVVVLAAFVLSLVLTQLTLPFFNTLANKQTTIPWTSPAFWMTALGFALFTGLISGSYPAFYLSAFNPARVLKGAVKTGRLALLPRKVLVVVQFTVSVTLIICTVVVFKQVEFAKSRMAGFSRDGLITVYINTPELNTHFDMIANEAMRTGAIENVARTSQSPAHFGNNNSVEWRGKDPNLVIFFNNVAVTPTFGKTVGWKIKEGRDFHAHTPDSTSVLLNEAAIKVMGFKDPIGETIVFWDKPYTVAGVVHDMITQSPYEPVQPAIFLPDGWMGVILMKLNPALTVQEAIAKLEPVFKKNNPSGPFEFSFVDQAFGHKFASEERIGKLAAFFTILAVFISCLGLFGLASFVAAQRTKEIGIRKVLGASVTNLWQMLSKDFVVLVLISCAISIPLSVWLMGDWLEHYDYRTSITWHVLAGSAFGAFAITLLTVSFQAIRAAVSNPVKSLRSE
ncbi:ABC transporter permease [Chryseolinea sp. Jin1]|uniref:ABC transporter permease n=2 Tax=Chryseolinea lacunae TaxID=2801331 RepID=A0ABS1KM44_9BACT|nr:ABC transporter permease [Chryseolinea lacunae]